MTARVHRRGSRVVGLARWGRFMAAGLMLVGMWLQAADPRLLPVGAPWHWWVVGSETSTPPTNWQVVEFDDSGWARGPSGFSSLGDEASYLSGSTPISACFRGRFMVEDPSAVQWLILRADYVSGFVACLNGHEVARRGVEGNPPLPDALATPHARHATEELDLSAYRHLLVPGTNVLAVQLHGSTTPAATLVLVPELCANFQRGPFLQNVSTQRAEIVWRTPVAATTEVEYGSTPAFDRLYADPAPVTNHIAILEGLTPGTEWFYRVRSAAGMNEAVSPVHSFHTLRAVGDLSFAVFGDSGSAWLSQLQVASCLATANVDLVLHAGDITYFTLNRGLVDTRCLSVYGPQMRSTPFFFTTGNHDLYAVDGLATYLETFRMPTNTATGTMHFYSFDHGDAHFISLFVPTLMNFSGTAPFALRPESAQLEWLTNDLATTTCPWRIVFLHSPLFTSAGHRRDDYNYNGVPDRLELQTWLLPVLSQHGVQVVFSGHDHAYERFAPVNGVHCFVSGGGGYTLYGLLERDALSRRFESVHHHLRATIVGEEMTVQAVDRFGVVFDTASIPRVSLPQLRADVASEGRLSLRWNAAPGRWYHVESAPTLSGPYAAASNAVLPVLATNYVSVVELDLSAPDVRPASQFYRVRILP